jgi:hypothetical protein
MGNTGDHFHPTCFVEISPFLDKKLQAMSAYEAEICEFPHPRSIKAIQALATRRGSQAGLKSAEGFMLLRKIVR